MFKMWQLQQSSVKGAVLLTKEKNKKKKQTSGSVYFEKTKIINEEREALFLLLKSSHKAKPYKSISGHDPKSPGCYWLGAYLHKV